MTCGVYDSPRCCTPLEVDGIEMLLQGRSYIKARCMFTVMSTIFESNSDINHKEGTGRWREDVRPYSLCVRSRPTAYFAYKRVSEYM